MHFCQSLLRYPAGIKPFTCAVPVLGWQHPLFKSVQIFERNAVVVIVVAEVGRDHYYRVGIILSEIAFFSWLSENTKH